MNANCQIPEPSWAKIKDIGRYIVIIIKSNYIVIENNIQSGQLILTL